MGMRALSEDLENCEWYWRNCKKTKNGINDTEY